MIVALAGACARDDAWTELLLAGSHLMWDTGPLRDRAGLCHGTAGNAYALLALWQRTADELWLARARRLREHALSAGARGRVAAEGRAPRLRDARAGSGRASRDAVALALHGRGRRRAVPALLP